MTSGMSETGASTADPSFASPELWVEQFGDTLFRLALVRVRKPEIAEDLVQDTLLAAFRNQSGFGGRSSVQTWLTGILKHKITDYFRKSGREINFTELAFLEADSGEKFDGDGHWREELAPRAWEGEGAAAMNRTEFFAALQACLAKLPERVAAVFVMREMDDLPGSDICRTLSISESNLWVMLHRARGALRQCLEVGYFEVQMSGRE